MKPFHRYLLFQIPGWTTIAAVAGFLHASAGLTTGLAIGVVAFVMALDFILYPFFRHSYASQAQVGPEALIGQRAKVVKALAPEGFVRLRGERWRADLIDSGQGVAEGETVEVVEVRGLTLLVRRES